METISKKPSFEVSVDAGILANVLQGVAVGQTVTYEDLSKSIGRNVLSHRGLLATARAIAQREHRAIFGTVNKTGLKRLCDTDVVGLGDGARSRIRNIAKRTAKKLQCVNYAELSREAQTKHNTTLSMFGVIGELGSERAFMRLHKKVEQSESLLPTVKASLAALGAAIDKANSRL